MGEYFIVERIRTDGVGVPFGFAAHKAAIVYADMDGAAKFHDARSAGGFLRMAKSMTTIYKGQTEEVRVRRIGAKDG